MSEVYDRYVDTAGNYHYTDVETGHHVIPNTAVGSDMNCKNCRQNCAWAGKERSEHGKCFVGYIPTTNADRIRSMTDAELAEWLNEMQAYSYNCGLLESMISEYPVHYSKWFDWLKEEVEE